LTAAIEDRALMARQSLLALVVPVEPLSFSEAAAEALAAAFSLCEGG
jgi:hypothetical protein